MYKYIVYICVLCEDVEGGGKKKERRRRRYTGNTASFLGISADLSFGCVCFYRLLGSLIGEVRPVAVYRLRDVCEDGGSASS